MAELRERRVIASFLTQFGCIELNYSVCILGFCLRILTVLPPQDLGDL